MINHYNHPCDQLTLSEHDNVYMGISRFVDTSFIQLSASSLLKVHSDILCAILTCLDKYIFSKICQAVIVYTAVIPYCDKLSREAILLLLLHTSSHTPI